ncbi:hypothetical protein PsorP6_004821 [Peronosclerospora sorghi]|uniref:Uncharacterized protein n=1 Tax=Peronosclerospora sorghi TaxID=230839 RepID=A0ACC0VLM8_9STRA|nr:hypothetical protein PsorP6_004821 [Peronosclerospora sorghi]
MYSKHQVQDYLRSQAVVDGKNIRVLHSDRKHVNEVESAHTCNVVSTCPSSASARFIASTIKDAVQRRSSTVRASDVETALTGTLLREVPYHVRYRALRMAPEKIGVKPEFEYSNAAEYIRVFEDGRSSTFETIDGHFKHANRNVVGLGFAVTQTDDEDNRSWFLAELSPRHDELRFNKVSKIISDLDKGLIPAARAILPSAVHVYCVEHI